MCSICKSILVGFSIIHTELDCPLRKSYYCTGCARYGHRSNTCPAMPMWKYREPIYAEQLEPNAAVHTMTPLPIVYSKEPNYLRIKNTDESIKDFLTAQGIKFKKNFRRLLHDFADLKQMRIVYTE